MVTALFESGPVVPNEMLSPPNPAPEKLGLLLLTSIVVESRDELSASPVDIEPLLVLPEALALPLIALWSLEFETDIPMSLVWLNVLEKVPSNVLFELGPVVP